MLEATIPLKIVNEVAMPITWMKETKIAKITVPEIINTIIYCQEQEGQFKEE